MSPPSVRRVTTADYAAVSSALTEAFVDESGLNYWLRQGRGKQRARELFFDKIVAEDVLHPRRETWLAEENGRVLGSAIWLPPGAIAFDLHGWNEIAVMPTLYRIAGVEGMSKALKLGKMLEARHPKAPHAHLAFLGVATVAQGQGVGSALLKATLAPVDAAKLDAYLETTTERNVALYQRHGFEVTDRFDLPGVTFWTMTRPARL